MCIRDSPTFVIACSIPISVVAALVMMYFSGVTLNIISLSGLALGVGMLVDNSIVVIENIYRMRNEGVPARKAAIEMCIRDRYSKEEKALICMAGEYRRKRSAMRQPF